MNRGGNGVRQSKKGVDAIGQDDAALRVEVLAAVAK